MPKDKGLDLEGRTSAFCRQCQLSSLRLYIFLLQAFRDVVADEGVLPEPTKKLLFSTFDPIYDFHCAFLSELEQRMALW